MFVATDERDWPTLETCFTDPLTLDMTSMTGGTPVTMTPKDVALASADGFRPLDHVHHQVGNFRSRIYASAGRGELPWRGVASPRQGGGPENADIRRHR